MQVGFKPAPRTLVLAICEEQSLLRALASLELAWAHFQLFDLMKENQLLGPVLAEERLNLSSVHAMSGLASPRTDCCVSRNGRIQREWLRHASLRRQVAVTWAAALFITGTTNPFSDPMAAWSFALSHAVASGAAIACGPYECQGSRLVLFARCAQTVRQHHTLSHCLLTQGASLVTHSRDTPYHFLWTLFRIRCHGPASSQGFTSISSSAGFAVCGKIAGFAVRVEPRLSKRHYCSRVPLTRTRSCRSRVDALPRARRHRRRRPSPRVAGIPTAPTAAFTKDELQVDPS